MTEGELRRHYGPAAQEILQVRPGLAGLWQISGRNRLTYAERRDLDLKLVRGRSARLYIEILLRTVPESLKRLRLLVVGQTIGFCRLPSVLPSGETGPSYMSSC
jgi:lipopolysaccharide/colanic/teichoic acid biosynthesis glycosyltransferase